MKSTTKQKAYSRSLRKNQTNAEKLLWYRLRNRQLAGIKFRRQQPIGPYIIDFISFERKLIVEIDGGQHNEEKKIVSDNDRTAYLKKNGFTVLRFWNNEVLEHVDQVLEALTLTLSQNGRGKEETT